jgi:hypothetical protein
LFWSTTIDAPSAAISRIRSTCSVADRHLVERLARADAEEHAPGEQALERRPRLRDQARG